MRLGVNELAGHLTRGLAPIYLVFGDEPLQLGEAADAIRRCARGEGYTGREVFDVGPAFDWSALSNEVGSLSLFAERRIIDLRLHSPKVGSEGGKVLADYAEHPAPDTLLLVTGPKADGSVQRTRWFGNLEKRGVLVPVWPVAEDRLPRWIEQRMRRAGLQPAAGVSGMLAQRVEGNLLAAAQEIDKLLLLCGPGLIGADELAEAVADSARYDVFALVDAVLKGRVGRARRILGGLRAEGVAPPVVLWALSREIRVVASIAWDMRGDQGPERAMQAWRQGLSGQPQKKLWDRRAPLIRQALARHNAGRWRDLLRCCGRVDRIIKGRLAGEPWDALLGLCTGMAGMPGLSGKMQTCL